MKRKDIEDICKKFRERDKLEILSSYVLDKCKFIKPIDDLDKCKIVVLKKDGEVLIEIGDINPIPILKNIAEQMEERIDELNKELEEYE